MLRTNHLFQKVQNLYGTPSGFSEERRRAYYQVNKSTGDVAKELSTIDSDLDSNFYILTYNGSTIVGINT